MGQITVPEISEVKLNKERKNNAKAAEMYKFYQENISRSQTTTAELLKGVHAGDNSNLLPFKGDKDNKYDDRKRAYI